jgi:hypothetical protein
MHVQACDSGLKDISEKYLNKLIGRTDMEDALKRLDFLTREEAWMAIAQNMRDMRNLHERVTEVIDGVQNIFSQSPKQYSNLDSFRWEGSKEGYEANSQRRRSNKMFVISEHHQRRL